MKDAVKRIWLASFMVFLVSFPSKFLILLIDIYKLVLSPFIGNQCRFYPTCSTYAREAIQVHGAFIGAVMSFWRILRCNPMSRGGYDPVPRAMPRGTEKGE